MTALWKEASRCAFAVVQYGDEIRTELNFQEGHSRLQVLERVRSITQLGKVTKTASAIQHTLDNVFRENGSRRNARKIMIVLTDGEIFMDPLNLTNVINSPKMGNTERFAIGVGFAFTKSSALAELQLIATDPVEDHLFQVDSYIVLEASVAILKANILEKRKEGMLEIAFVLDGSGSIEHEDFQRAKNFISKTMREFWRNIPKCAFAVVQYGDEIRTELNFQESHSKLQALERVQSITQLGRVTKTASAIQHVLNNVFTENGMKRKARKIMVVVTDGEIFMDPLNLGDVINSPKIVDMDIERFAIAVGDAFNKRSALAELQLIATDPVEDHLFRVDSYMELEASVAILKANILEKRTKNTPVPNLNSNNNNNNDNDDEDPEKGTEIAIVLDGSGSIEPEDFEKAKKFISDMIYTFWKKCYECDFAVVQYGEEIKTEFNLRDSRENPRGLREKLENITQLGKVTKTASALQHVLDNIFSKENGSREDSTKIIVVLTDGEIFMDPMNLSYVINSSKMASIDDRYAIGVGDIFNKPAALTELKQIAKYDDDDHLFRVDNYEGLNSLLSKLEKNIIGIEGTSGSTLQLELAQAGFSAHYLDNGNILIGAVGAFDWNGGMILQHVDKKIQFLNDSKVSSDRSAKFGYLGYSVVSVKRNNAYQYLYVSGAPRHSGTGRVLVFGQDDRTIKREPDLEGEQVGSYFGAELCALDIDKNTVTDYLLVGAPFFHIRGEEGKVYVYAINSEDNLDKVTELRGSPKYYSARFGFAISNIGDINMDGYNDIAIGAPLEEDKPGTSGSVYIFNGQNGGLMDTFSQRIKAADVHSGLMYFGQSIDGGFDLTSDGLIDIAVGAYGHVTVLRSRPVITFNTMVKFSPEKVPLSSQTPTRSSDATPVIIDVKVCFEKQSSFTTNIWIQLSYIDYTMELDVAQENKRIQFKDDKKLYSVRLVENNCWDHKLDVLPCTTDCYSDIIIRIKYSLRNTDESRDNPAPVLDKFSTFSSNFSLPYEKNCGTDDICIAKLSLKTSLPDKNIILIIGITKELTTNISLENEGEDAYMTTMVLKYPRILKFKQLSKTELNSSPNLECTESSSANSSHSTKVCKIGHPVFKAKAQLQFTVSWQLDSTTRYPNETATVTIAVNCSNGNDGRPISKLHSLQVKHAFEAVLTQPLSSYIVNVSKERTKEMEYKFKIKGNNPFGARVNITITIPIKVQDKMISIVKSVEGTQNTTVCKFLELTGPHDPSKETRDIWNCSVAQCQLVLCTVAPENEDIHVTAAIELDTVKTITKRTISMELKAVLSFDESKFVRKNREDYTEETKITVTLLKEEVVVDFQKVVIGSSVGGLILLGLLIFVLYKCGFFKRNYKEKLEKDHQETEPNEDSNK